MHAIRASTLSRISQLGSIAPHDAELPTATLLNLHKGFIESKLLVSAPQYCLPQKAHDDRAYNAALHRLDITQRRSLSIVAGLLPGTQIDAVHLETRTPPLSVTAALRGALATEALLRNPPHWFNRPLPPPPPGNHAPTLQPRVELRRLHSQIWGEPSHTSLTRTSRPTETFRPWSTSFVDSVTFGATLPASCSPDDKLSISLTALAPYRDSFLVLATDGSVMRTSTGTRSCSAAVLTSPLEDGVVTANRPCGPYADSYRTETVAILLGLDLVIEHAATLLLKIGPDLRRRVLVVSDSQSALRRLSRGPLLQSAPTELQIWQRLKVIARADIDVHFQFVYSHCGVEENERADDLASSCFVTIPEHAPLSEANARAHLKRRAIALWRDDLRMNTHRFALVGHTPTPKTPLCPATLARLTRTEQVQLARIRSGQSELFGSYRQRVLRPEPDNPQCRWCAPATDVATGPPAATTQQVHCPCCHSSFPTVRSVDEHLKRAHPELNEQRPTCGWCKKTFASTRSRGVHYHACPLRKQVIDPPQPPQAVLDSPLDNVLHFLACPDLSDARAAHHVDAYRAALGKKYFFSRPFLHWVHFCTNGPFATPTSSPPAIPSDTEVDDFLDDWDLDCGLYRIH
eukprot:PhM_4_TR16085/c1_g1_i2/m.38491